MSLRGQINKVNNDFANAVHNAAMKGNIDAQGGIYGTRKITGYVCNVHGLDDEDESLCGTVDVQEYEYEQGEDKYEGVGHHQGVLCSAIQNNKSGFYIMPTMYSDVVIVQDPVTMEEYVLMCSHVDVIQLQSHQSIKVGVVETEEFQESDGETENPDYDELEETGNSAITQYDKEKITHYVKTKDGELTITQTAEKIEIVAKDTTISIDTNGKVTLSAKEVSISGDTSLKTTSPKTTIDGNQVEVTGNSFIRKGTANIDGQGGFCGIPVCPFTGAVHTGSTIVGG